MAIDLDSVPLIINFQLVHSLTITKYSAKNLCTCIHCRCMKIHTFILCLKILFLLSPTLFLPLSLLGYSYERLDGSVRGEERFLAVQNFSNDEDTFIFLLSTRAGDYLIN